MPKTIRSPQHRALLDLLVAARKEAGLTQASVAKRLGRPQSYIAKVENGERRVDVVELFELADAIGRNPIDLITAFAGRL